MRNFRFPPASNLLDRGGVVQQIERIKNFGKWLADSWQSLGICEAAVAGVSDIETPKQRKLPYCQPLVASDDKISLAQQGGTDAKHSHLMMSPGTTSLSGAVDALGAMKGQPLVALEGRVGCSSFEGLDRFTLKLLCVKTLIADILLYQFVSPE